MNRKQQLYRNLRQYKPYYVLIALAVILTNTIITGSLLTGDSIAHTLITRVDQRLGQTLTTITSGTSFMDDALVKQTSMNESSAPVLMTDGFVSNNQSLLPVTVWGVDSCLTRIVSPGFVFPATGEVVINRKMADELSVSIGDYLSVRLPNTQMIPSGSLFVTDNYTASLRLQVKAIVETHQSGNLHLRNEQVIPFNLFVNRQELGSELELKGKCNLILSNRRISEEALSTLWKPSFSGIQVEKEEEYQEVVSERIFLEEELVERLDTRFRETNHLFSYLVNGISAHGDSIPYSFVTAIDRFSGIELRENDIVLSDYAAHRIRASMGDTVMLSYYVSAELKALKEEKQPFVVRAIVPLSELKADGKLSARFPGLHDVESCTDWDSDLPIDMDRIAKVDEDYWDLHRTTPKALIAYSQGAMLWGNNYGVATGIRISAKEEVMPVLEEVLTLSDAGVSVFHPREMGIEAAKGGVDFKSLFLSLAFFVIVAALLLATIPLGGMLQHRQKELQLLQSLGYTSRRIRKLLINELGVLVIASTLLGLFTAILYNLLVLYALGNIWQGAVHTEDFLVSIQPLSLLIGSVSTCVICFATLHISIRRMLNKGDKRKISSHSIKGKAWLPLSCISLMIALCVINAAVVQSPLLFMLTGLIGLAAALSGYAYIIHSRSIHYSRFNQQTILYRNLNYRLRSDLVSIAVLASGIFIVFSVGLNRKSFSDASTLASGTGSFALWGDHTVPIYHDLSTEDGRERYGLTDLPPDTYIHQFYRHGGDDASCLNLNKAPQPTVLGVDVAILSDASFSFAAKIDEMNDDRSVWNGLSEKRGNYYPVIADQTVLQWGLMKSVGDTITYLNKKGEPVTLQFIGGLNTSIFQGNLLMDKALFAEIWGENGSQVMLVQTPDTARQTVRQLLSQALSNYGVRYSLCNDRLKEFNSVTDSYLSIFLMLGGLGLIIGLFGMMLILRRNLSGRKDERSTLRAIGFDEPGIYRHLFRESILVPLYSIVTGTVCALLAVASNIPAVDGGTWLVMLGILILLFVVLWRYARSIISRYTYQ